MLLLLLCRCLCSITPGFCKPPPQRPVGRRWRVIDDEIFLHGVRFLSRACFLDISIVPQAEEKGRKPAKKRNEFLHSKPRKSRFLQKKSRQFWRQKFVRNQETASLGGFFVRFLCFFSSKAFFSASSSVSMSLNTPSLMRGKGEYCSGFGR